MFLRNTLSFFCGGLQAPNRSHTWSPSIFCSHNHICRKSLRHLKGSGCQTFTRSFQKPLVTSQGRGKAAAPCCPLGRGPSRSERPTALSYEQNVCPASECKPSCHCGLLNMPDLPATSCHVSLE